MAMARIPMVRKLKVLPSGPTVPPVSQPGPCNDAFDKCPSSTRPLFGTEYRNVSPKSKLACHPTHNHRLPVRRKANAKISPIATTPAAPTQPSPGFPKWTAPNEHESTIAAGQKPMLSASVYCVYPRNVNSSNKPTNTEISTNPMRQPCQNNFPKAPLSGNP